MKRILSLLLVLCCLLFSGCGKESNSISEDELFKITSLEELAELQYSSYLGDLPNGSSQTYQEMAATDKKLLLVRCKDTLNRRNTSTQYADIRVPLGRQKGDTYTSDRKAEVLWCSDPDFTFSSNFTVTERCGLTETGQWYFDNAFPMEQDGIYLICARLTTVLSAENIEPFYKIDLNYLRLNPSKLLSAIAVVDIFMESDDLPNGMREALLQSTQKHHNDSLSDKEQILYDTVMNDESVIWRQAVIASGYEKKNMEYLLHYCHDKDSGLWFFRFEDGFAYYYEE